MGAKSLLAEDCHVASRRRVLDCMQKLRRLLYEDEEGKVQKKKEKRKKDIEKKRKERIERLTTAN